MSSLLKDVLKLENYTNITILREKGRLDIWAKDELSKHCFIIENKINDATDRDDQLLDYYEYAQTSGYTVDVVIYLSRDGTKVAPAQSKKINTPIVNIASFNNKDCDLLSGWLRPAYLSATKEDSRSFLFQYCKLIAHLSNSYMGSSVKEKFYQFVSEHQSLDTIVELNHLITEFPNYRAERFGIKTENFAPFKKRWMYYRNYWIFERYTNADGSYKLDVFFESNGGAKVVLWNTVKKENGGYETVKALLERIGMVDRFRGTSLYHGCTAEFSLSEDFKTIEEIDNAVLNLVLQLFQKLEGA